jgi:hypothetical protein
MSFDRIIKETLIEAGIAEQAFDAAIKKAGFKNRFDWFLQGGSPEIQKLYNDKVRAERAGIEAVARALA